MNPNKILTSEKYKQQALNSLDSSYGIILKNGAFMLDDKPNSCLCGFLFKCKKYTYF